MAVSKRLRYEILRRDNHACRYCGATAPDAPLRVDHVMPRALGGGDEPANLVTACEPCNSGKSSSSPDAPIVDDVAADALRWGRAMERAAEIQQLQRQDEDAFVHDFFESWGRWADGTVPMDQGYRQSILTFRRAGLGFDELLQATRDAMQAGHIPTDRVWRYFCGICWRVVEQRREIAAALVQEEEQPPVEYVPSAQANAIVDAWLATPTGRQYYPDAEVSTDGS